MSRPHDVKPIARHDFFRADFFSDFVDENFRAAAGQRVQAGRLKSFERFQNRQARAVGEVLNLRGRERVNRYVEIFFDEPQHFLVVAQRQVGVQAALNHKLRSARLDGLANFLQNFFVRQKIRAALIFPTEERAKFTFVLAHVRVIYISVDDESFNIAEIFFANRVGRLAQLKQISARKNFQRLAPRQSQINSLPNLKFLILNSTFLIAFLRESLISEKSAAPDGRPPATGAWRHLLPTRAARVIVTFKL